jgi:hypothetical protein
MFHGITRGCTAGPGASFNSLPIPQVSIGLHSRGESMARSIFLESRIAVVLGR